jgi:hypothetical protein
MLFYRSEEAELKKGSNFPEHGGSLSLLDPVIGLDELPLTSFYGSEEAESKKGM